MFQRRKTYNPKRQIHSVPVSREDRAKLNIVARNATYGGNPEHKRNPGDFHLTPPANWKPDKELCDRISVFQRTEATRLMRNGIRKGLVSIQQRNGWPQNIWSMTDSGEAIEAELENQEIGSYHGYPMSVNDPFRKEVIKRWNIARNSS